MLFTLLVDDVDGLNDTSIWNIYYHLFLDDRSLKLFQTQSKKLHDLAGSIDGWHSSIYGKLLRFSDTVTLKRISEVWGSYSTSALTEDEKATYDKRFKAGIQKAVDARNKFMGPGCVLTGYRSTAPVSAQSLQDLPQLFQYFWDHGVTDKSLDTLSKTKHSNPMFASLITDTFTLHYGTDPVLGFHLATAYVSLAPESPLSWKAPWSQLHNLVAAARVQFQAWAVSFRRSASQNLTIRFFVGDALAFSHTLQHKRATGIDDSAHWYRTPYHLEPLILDGSDYNIRGKAPLVFNIIDTSNLTDHLGAINLLVATSPLLANSLSATLYTESLVKVAEDHKDWIETLLCSHFPTVSILLGLFPVEYWTNATAISTVDDGIMDSMPILTGIKGGKKEQMRTRLVWKRPISSLDGLLQPDVKIRIDEQDLANMLYQVYRGMFQNEDIRNLFSNISLLKIRTSSRPNYHRGSFASFLCLVKGRMKADWDKVMDGLLPLVENDPNILMGRNYIQELYLQLHLLDVYTMPSFRPSFNQSSYGPGSLSLGAWKDIPGVVCITLKVPRKNLGVFTSLAPEKLGTPNVHCILQSAGTSSSRPWQNIFAAVQLAFGTVTTSNPRNRDEFQINVAEDERGWTGRSPLLASFYAPTWVALLEPRTTTIAFGVQSTPLSTQTFVKTLGTEMNVYETTLVDEDNVYITKHLPNQSGYTSVCKYKDTDPLAKESPDVNAITTVMANVERETARIVSFTGRVDFLTEETKSILRGQSLVQTLQLSACAIAVHIGKNRTKYLLHFPAPVQNSRAKIRIARKSSYVEVIVPTAFPTDDNNKFPHFMYPSIQPGMHGPVVWNMPYLNLDCLPVLDVGKRNALQWLITHTSLQFSTRERRLRDSSMSSTPNIKHKDVRVNFKDGLFSMFMHFSGLHGGKAHIFGINNPTGGGVHILIFVSCLRLDIANHTVVLDSAVLPLTDRLMPRLERFLGPLSVLGLCNIKVDDDELRLWKEVLPCYVERCRKWAHRPSCEYVAKGHIPLSVEHGELLLCSCGNGFLPPGFISGIPEWDIASKYAVRAAISPSFSVSFVEPTFDVEKIKRDIESDAHHCQKCWKEKSDDSTKLLTCSGCHIAKYCSVECQRADWKVHKKVCGK